MSEKCSVKRSVIGAHCTIGKNCKIKDSVIMDYVVIEDGVKLEGCVVCSSAKILEKASLKDCEVANGFEVEKDSKYVEDVWRRIDSIHSNIPVLHPPATAKNEAFIDYSE